MENNIMQNAINYLAQSLCITPNQLIDAYAAKGEALVYMVFTLIAICIAIIIALIVLFSIKDNEIVEIAQVVLPLILLFLIFIILLFAYDAYLWICDPRAYAIKELLADIKLWK